MHCGIRPTPPEGRRPGGALCDGHVGALEELGATASRSASKPSPPATAIWSSSEPPARQQTCSTRSPASLVAVGRWLAAALLAPSHTSMRFVMALAARRVPKRAARHHQAPRRTDRSRHQNADRRQHTGHAHPSWHRRARSRYVRVRRLTGSFTAPAERGARTRSPSPGGRPTRRPRSSRVTRTADAECDLRHLSELRFRSQSTLSGLSKRVRGECGRMHRAEVPPDVPPPTRRLPQARPRRKGTART